MLVAESGGVTALAAAIKRSASQVSQWLNSSPDSRTQKPRTISNASARYIEQQSGLAFGWMDQPTEAQGQPPPPKKAPAIPLPTADPPEITAVVDLMRRMCAAQRGEVLGYARRVAESSPAAGKANGAL